jgi:RHS repeat-associated protein
MRSNRSSSIETLGSTPALADATGTIQTYYTYGPFGNTAISGASSANPFQFTGRENDGTGLYFYRARYYSPASQRFIAQDPIGFAGGDPNIYAYAHQAPSMAVDPSGLDSYFIRFFIDIGAGVEVGTNPDGTSFVTVDFGFGEDIGFGYNPSGTSPGYNQNGPSTCSIGSFGQAGAHFGGADIGLGAETGTDFGKNGAAPYTGSGPSTTASGPLGGGVELGGSAGGRISIRIQ